ncbi:hypothetical protein AJ79_04885 [Helicocarpus griseus UAMH5409]|uniref:Calcineurin-like phosphoesterase domain-containing protein n=1 Tax=Helicocarpus griseus UAMH5409 TaxID=1447875 RepID=A0A2B7XI35_9EURO|nr:hypothetical protein AJ79_04885 [Helicocarpus griseus UAMH5409]
MSTTIKTRFLILSDTHSLEFTPETEPQQQADVAIHCGDLTQGSTLDEFRSAIKLLANLNAPLKLVIAGNHDFTLDTPFFKRRVENQFKVLPPDLIKRAYGDLGEARQLFNEESAVSAGIVFLEEGTHHFTLKNGSSLTVYASPLTPSCGGWAFQFARQQGHEFAMEKGVDLVMTHGPPKGVLDRTLSGDKAGSTHVFDAVARCRPRLHCFGHIHEAWGAKVVTWREEGDEISAHSVETDVEDERSAVLEDLSTLSGSKSDPPEILKQKVGKLEKYSGERCVATSHCFGDVNAVEAGKQTLFVNASIKGVDEDYPVQLPWLVDIELAKAG